MRQGSTNISDHSCSPGEEWGPSHVGARCYQNLSWQELFAFIEIFNNSYKSFGASSSVDDIFLLASISKPMSAAALMTLYDQGEFRLDDPVRKFVPEFSGGARDKITVRQLLTHVSGLPDQLPENQSLRRRHAKLSEFVDRAIRTPLLFAPGSQYKYSSMAILLASEMAQWFVENIDQVAFRLELVEGKDGRATIRWHGRAGGEPVTFDTEPYTGLWRRLGIGFLGLLPIESQL